MKRLSFEELSPGEPGRVVEKLEILRTRLRLASHLDKSQINDLLADLSELRSDFLLARSASSIRSDSQPVSAGSSKPASPKTTHADLGFEGVLGESPGVLEALEIVRRAAPTTLPMLIDGESGTGKELFARVIHNNSARADEPFVSVNCGAIPENLIESELFGHKKGAFTGATSDRKGRFEAADGGTIFLDEVGELPMQGQVKLLRVLQAQEVQRVGSDTPVSVDTRVVAATNRNLAEMAEAGTFREDLYYRLSVIQVSLPSLRERRDEIPLLCDYFLAQAAQELDRAPLVLGSGLRRFLETYRFPGNIRELRNMIFRLSCLADGEAGISHLPVTLRSAPEPESDANPAVATIDVNSLADVRRKAGDDAERRFLEEGLRQTSGRVVDLARRLDMNRSYLQTLLKKHGLKSKAFRQSSGG